MLDHLRRIWRGGEWVAGIAAVLMLLVSCSPTTPPAATNEATPPPEASPTPATTSSEPGAVESAIVARYLAFWGAVAEAADPPDPGHPALDETAADPQLEQLQGVLARDLEQGRFRRVVGTHNPEVRELLDGGAAAVVDDCVELDPEDGTYDAETGERISEPTEPGYRELLEARLELIEGEWKVVNVNVVEEDSECEPAAP
jgi:hypothetical protein